MRFRTIWSLRGLPLSERLRRTRDWAAMTIGAKLPLRIRFWVTMLEIGHATAKSPNVPATPLDDILHNMRRPNSMS
jgi:hypothetical protein